MPHATLCVSRLLSRRDDELGGEVSMPHAALCVSRPKKPEEDEEGDLRFNAARSIVCVETGRNQEEL